MLDQILINLFSNSLKYSNKKIAEIELNVSENSSHYLFIVKDNGPGISKKNQTTIFNLLKSIPPSVIPYKYKGNKSFIIFAYISMLVIWPIILYQVGKSWSLASKKIKQGAIIKYIK